MKRHWVFVSFLLWPIVAGSVEPLPDVVTIRGVEFVRIPAGEFIYTVETPAKREQPHGPPMFRDVRIWLDEFYIARFEALARDLERFYVSGDAPEEMLARHWANPALRWGTVDYNETTHPYHRDGDDPGCTVRRSPDGRIYRPEPDRENLPATDLSWEMADAFARWMGFRLPTEAEWQKAARGTDRRIWPWGDDFPDDTRAYFRTTRFCAPMPVGMYAAGRSPYGIDDMAGGMTEYVADWLNEQFDDSLRDGMRNPPLATEGWSIPRDVPQNKKIAKGGRYNEDPRYIAIAARRIILSHDTSGREGVRFAIDSAVVRHHLGENMPRRDVKELDQ